MTGLPEAPEGAALPEAAFPSCFSSLGCPEYTLGEMATLALGTGISLLELRALENTTDLPRLLFEAPGGWEGARDLLRRRNLRVRMLGSSFKLVGGGEDQWAGLLDFARLAEALEVPYLRAFGGGTWGKALKAGDYQEAAENLRWWEGEREAQGWKCELVVETHDAFSASAPCLRLLEQSGTAVNFLWDSHHTWKLGGEFPAETWGALGPHVRHVHVKDSVSRSSGRHPYTYVLPGAGEMPLREVMALLEREDYTGAISLEWEKLWHPYLPSLTEALQTSRDWFAHQSS